MSKAQSVQTGLIGKKARYARSWFGEDRPASIAPSPLKKHWDEWGELAAVVSSPHAGTIFHIKWPDGSLSIELTSRMIEFEPNESFPSENADEGSDVIKCPKCFNRSFSLLEDVISSRPVAIDEQGGLIIARRTRYSDGDEERLECNSCHYEFHIPEEVSVKYL